MNDLEIYLKNNYRTANELAAACDISVDELDGLVKERLVPQPSYTVNSQDTLISQAFGELPAGGASAARYFHPGNAAWITLALDARKESGAEQAHRNLKDRFKRNFIAALQELDKTTFRLSDSFTNTGQPIARGLDSRAEKAWDSFLKGVFSLCVADPSSEKAIARKEVLQEALTNLSDSGLGADSSPEAKSHALDLIGQYAQAAMPFSPPEYPRSSRKRLVEDLRTRISALTNSAAEKACHAVASTAFKSSVKAP